MGTKTQAPSAAPPQFSTGTDPHEAAFLEVERTERIAVTPELAQRWLDLYEDGSDRVYNRTPGGVWVIKLARDMSHNRWKQTGVPIIMGTHGKVLDGRQRLEAVVLSGQTITFDVRFGVDPDAQSAMDRPRRRTVANDLQMQGVPNQNVVAATCVLLLHWESGRILDNRFAPTDSEVIDFEYAHREELQLAVRQANRIRGRVPTVTLTVVATVFYRAVAIDEDACMRFFHQFETGVDLPDGSPILALRNTVLRYGPRNKPRRHEQLFQAVYAWNLWRDGKSKLHLRVPNTLTSDTFPGMK